MLTAHGLCSAISFLMLIIDLANATSASISDTLTTFEHSSRNGRSHGPESTYENDATVQIPVHHNCRHFHPKAHEVSARLKPLLPVSC